jgi:hypothetical protein
MVLRNGRRAAGLLVLTVLVAGVTLPLCAGGAKSRDDWVSLFNGKDLDGWDTWLGRPQGGKEPIGLNKDPKGVYSVVTHDGKPAIRISGEIFGALTSKKEYENYHIRLQFKWGEKKWPPRENAVRDSGLLYHCVGPHGAAGTYWMRSQECQIQEKDCGDYWSVAGAIVDVEARLVNRNPLSPIMYAKGVAKFTVPRTLKSPDGKTRVDNRVIKSVLNEKEGDWNTIEVLTVGGTSVHVVNGKVNMVLTNSRQVVDRKEVPLTKGKIQIQSEGAEVFYRDIAVKPIKEIPAKYLQ